MATIKTKWEKGRSKKRTEEGRKEGRKKKESEERWWSTIGVFHPPRNSKQIYGAKQGLEQDKGLTIDPYKSIGEWPN